MHWLLQTAMGSQTAASDDEEAVDSRASVADLWAKALSMSGLTDEQLSQRIADRFGLELATFEHAAPRVMKLVPEKLARAHLVFPLREDDQHLAVATCDPTDLTAEEGLRFVSGRQPVFEIAAPDLVRYAIDTYYQPDSALEDLLDTMGEDGKSVDVLGDEAPESVTEEDATGEPVVRLTNLILREAIAQNASDIHLAPSRGIGTVRYRVDGVLHLHIRVPMPFFHRVVSRIKILGEMDISDRLRPQDGRARIQVKNTAYDLRISTVPTRKAEKCVIRVLYPSETAKLDDLGLPDREIARFRRMISHRDSIVLVTGPTGSGKSTSLYAALQELATGDVNVMTVEDPVEYELEGITQIQVERKRGVTFASALRAILRQDPDIILLGEIRDGETAEIAVQASQTGHLVLATLHTNDALGVVPRLVDLGLHPQAIAESICGMTAQRLVRRLRPDCTEEIDGELTEDERVLAEKYGVTPTVRAKQPPDGSNPYKGRVPVVESVLVTPTLRALIARGTPAIELREVAIRQGMRPLREAGRDLVSDGLTTLEELDRALGESEEDAVPDAIQTSRAMLDQLAQTEQAEDEAAGPETAGAAAAPSGRKPGAEMIPEVAAAAAEVGSAAPEVGSTGAEVRSAAATAASAAAQVASSSADAPLVIAEGADAEPAHILMADDDPIVRRIAENLLVEHGFRFTGVENGLEALEKLGSDPDFDLMVLDLNMPKVEGAEVLRLARQSPQSASLPIIVLTSADDPDTEIRMIDEGADDYIRKPLEAKRFIARIRGVLRRAGF